MGNKVYVVEVEPGQERHFDNWPACQAFVSGKPYPFAGGRTLGEARAKIAAAKAKRGSNFKPFKTTRASAGPKPKSPPPVTGLCSDAGTHGNPGPCEYQVTDLAGNRIGHRHLGVHTNNYAELAGIRAMLALALERGETDLYTDSQVCLFWIASGRLGANVKEPDAIMALLKDIRATLSGQPHLKLIKWETRRWGEIPADFGRK